MIDDVRAYWVGPKRKRVWNLAGGQGVQLAGGIGGLHLPDFSQVGAEPARKPGRIYRATRFNYRKVSLNVLVGDPMWAPKIREGGEWRNLDADWNGDLDAEVEGHLGFVTNRGYRWLPVRLESATDPVWSTEPGYLGMCLYSYVFACDSSFYRGFTAPYVVCNPGLNQFAGEVHNIGDREAYPVLKFEGPGTFTVGVPGRMTTFPKLLAGQTLEVNTDPDVKTVTSGDGTSRFGELGFDHNFSIPVAAGEAVTFTATATGTTVASKVTAEVVPQYMRAW
ncbi:hypothetical protein ACFTSD_02765 [Nocardiaceae bacterium NPDC056970]